MAHKTSYARDIFQCLSEKTIKLSVGVRQRQNIYKSVRKHAIICDFLMLQILYKYSVIVYQSNVSKIITLASNEVNQSPLLTLGRYEKKIFF